MTIEEVEREVTSMRVNPELWKRAKHEAIDKDMALADLVEEAIEIRLDPEAAALVEKYRSKRSGSGKKKRK